MQEELQAKRALLEAQLRKRDVEIANIRQLIEASQAASTPPPTAVDQEVTLLGSSFACRRPHDSE